MSKTFKQILENLSEGSTFAEITLMYYALKEGVIAPNSVVVEKINSLMFTALLGKQELGELPGILNPESTRIREGYEFDKRCFYCRNEFAHNLVTHEAAKNSFL